MGGRLGSNSDRPHNSDRNLRMKLGIYSNGLRANLVGSGGS